MTSLAKDTSTRYIGFCAPCGRMIKVQDERLVHHGYKRPGDGMIHGDCFGVDRTPHELSDETAKDYMERRIGPRWAASKARLDYLNQDEPAKLWFTKRDENGNRVRDPDTRMPVEIQLSKAEALALDPDQYYGSHYNWEAALTHARYLAKIDFDFISHDKTRIEGLIQSWEKRDLMTTEEEVAHKQTEKNEREQKKRVARDEKVQLALESLRKRIDSAFTKRRTDALADLYNEGWRKVRDVSGSTLTRDQILNMLDRDNIWSAFGMIDDGLYIVDHWYGKGPIPSNVRPDAWKRWQSRYDESKRRTVPGPWPESLGGGFAKDEWKNGY